MKKLITINGNLKYVVDYEKGMIKTSDTIKLVCIDGNKITFPAKDCKTIRIELLPDDDAKLSL